MKSFEYCVFIGHFQPFCFAHTEVLKEALNAAKNVIIVIGSAGAARNIKNPWTAKEREAMIASTLSEEDKLRVKFAHVRDYLYVNNMWLTAVQQAVTNIVEDTTDNEIAIIGQENDFPQWHFIKMRKLDRVSNSADIRGLYFTLDAAYKNQVHSNVALTLDKFTLSSEFKDLKEEYDFVNNYRRSWEGAPFPPTFVTVDAVVIKSGHILLVRRKGNPGRGLMALPGGFLNQNETTQVGALRELKEETGIKVTKEELEKSIKGQKLFDYPFRSNRGRTITNAFLIDLGAGPLPQVKGGDDAAKAFWVSLNDVAASESEFFEDHYHIIGSFVNKF